MENRKCVQCGLVNFAGVVECARCKAFVPRVLPEAAGVNPFEKDGSKPFPLATVAVVAVVLMVAAVAYFALKSDPPQNATQTPEQVKQQLDMHKAFEQAQKQDAERMAKMQEDMKNSAASFEKMKKEGFKMSDEQIKKNLARHCSEGVHFGPGRTPPGCTDDGRVQTPR